MVEVEALLGWIETRFDRSSGPGGQNVNKVNTRVTLLLDFRGCPRLSEWERERIASRLRSRLSADGRLRVVSQAARTQAANRAAGLARLAELLGQALARTKPRRATRPTTGAVRRRLETKRRRAETKALRRGPAG